ncbi:hypothetical protein U1Q18_043434, partial [Sarracenia purpurea var. burkii]
KTNMVQGVSPIDDVQVTTNSAANLQSISKPFDSKFAVEFDVKQVVATSFWMPFDAASYNRSLLLCDA